MGDTVEGIYSCHVPDQSRQDVFSKTHLLAQIEVIGLMQQLLGEVF